MKVEHTEMGLYHRHRNGTFHNVFCFIYQVFSKYRDVTKRKTYLQVWLAGLFCCNFSHHYIPQTCVCAMFTVLPWVRGIMSRSSVYLLDL